MKALSLSLFLSALAFAGQPVLYAAVKVSGGQGGHSFAVPGQTGSGLSHQNGYLDLGGGAEQWRAGWGMPDYFYKNRTPSTGGDSGQGDAPPDRPRDALGDSSRSGDGSQSREDGPIYLERLGQKPDLTAQDVSRLPSSEAAEGLSRKDYQRRILGDASEGEAAGSVSLVRSSARPALKKLPILLELRLEPPGEITLRQQVKELGQKAGFLPDSAHPVLYTTTEKKAAFVRGWVALDQMAQMDRLAYVGRFYLDSGNVRPNSPGLETMRRVRVILRVPPRVHLNEFVDRTLNKLRTQAEFRPEKSRFYRAYSSPEGRSIEVTGSLPLVKSLRLLEAVEVIKLEPAPEVPFPSLNRSVALRDAVRSAPPSISLPRELMRAGWFPLSLGYPLLGPFQNSFLSQ